MKYLLWLLYSMPGLPVLSQVPKPGSGTIRHIEGFFSDYIESRNIDIWLPDHYSSRKKYPVLYTHDGQMLFDSALTWNQKEWQVDETLTCFLRNKKTKPGHLSVI